MYWILAALFLLVMLAVPRLRPVAVIGCVILGGMLLWGVFERVRGTDPDNQPERGRPTTPAAMSQALPPEDLELVGLKLSGGGAPFRLTGEVMNRSSNLRLKSFMLDIRRRDCYEGALDPSGCVVLWGVRQWIELSVPPQQTREFAISIWARGDAPRAVGTLRDDFKVVTASGEPGTSSGAAIER